MKTGNPAFEWPLIMIAMVCLSIIAPSCKQFKEITISNKSDVYHRPYVDSQVLVWKDPKTSSDDFNRLIDKYMNDDPGMTKAECGSCDKSMVILQSAAMANGGGLSGLLTSNNPTGDIKPSGSGEPIAYWSFNYYMITNDPVNKKDKGDKKSLKPQPQQILNGEAGLSPVVVAVFDSGIDPGYVNAASANYSNLIDGCIGLGSNNGWNIPDRNPNVLDVYLNSHGHGKHVAALSIQKSAQVNLSPIKILPIKFISQGRSTLYDVLCGIAYASNRGADILNASFGYYASKAPGIGVPVNLMFQKFLRYYTQDATDKKMIVVAAAGNEDYVQQLSNCGMISRSLDDVYFFPASFAEMDGMNNIIPVTTVGEDDGLKVSPRQNFSPRIVNIGVIADKVENSKEFLFRSPYAYIQGSSYAAPLFTGLLSAYFDKIKANNPTTYFDRATILSFLTSGPTPIVTNDPALQPFIKDGLYIRH